MDEEKIEIKGTCESCGYAFEGVLMTDNGEYPGILCPKCGEETYNWDEAAEVDVNDKADGHEIEYNHVDQFKRSRT